MLSDLILINSPKTLSKLNINNNNSEHLIILDLDEYINDIHLSLKNIDLQCTLDIPRTKIYINNFKIESYKTLIQRLKHFDFLSIDQIKLIKILCTQAIWGLPLEILIKIYQNSHNNINHYIGELSKKKQITSSIFKFTINKDNIKIKTTKLLRQFKVDDIHDDKTTAIYKCNIFGNIYNNYLIFYWKHY